MRLSLVLFCTLFSITVKATSDLEWLVDLPSYIDKAIKSNSQEKLYCNAVEETLSKTNQNPYQSCLEQICGDPETFTSALDLWTKDYIELSGKDTEELKKTPVGKILNQKIEEFYKEDPNRLGNEKMRKELLEMANKPLQNMKVSIHGASGFLVAFEGFGIFNHGKYNEDTDKYEIQESAFVGVLESKRDRLKDLKVKVEDRINSVEQQYRYISAQEFMKIKYPSLDFKSGVLKYIEELSIIEGQYIKNVGGLLPFPLDLPLIKNKVKTNDISSVELDIMIQEASTVELFGDIFAHQDKFGKEISTEVESKLKDWFQDKSSDELKLLLKNKMTESQKEEVEEDKKRFLERDKSVEVCLDSYHRNAKLFPEKSEIQNLNVTVIDAKKIFIKKVLAMSGLSTESKEHIKARLDAIRFKLPYSKATYKDVLMNSIDGKITNNKKTKNALNNNFDMNSMFTFFTYTVAFPNEIGVDDEDEEESDGDIAELCQRLEQEAFSDATYTAFGEVKVSYTLATAPKNYQLQVIYHELGHNLDRIFRESSISDATSKAFKVTESCLGDVQKTISGDGNHTNFFGEDFADWVAAKVETNFTKSADCEYLKFDSDSGQYKNKTIFTDQDGAVHSSTVFRVLRYYVDKNKDLPKECSESLISEGVLGFEKKCSL
jgi:hypothetical protein